MSNHYKDLIKLEGEAFDKQSLERFDQGYIPDMRRLRKVDWFYNNEKSDPEIFKIHWLDRMNKIIRKAAEKGGKVLEVGCGMGMLTLELARNGLEVTGIDVSEKSLEIAKKMKNENPFLDGFGSLEYICMDFLYYKKNYIVIKFIKTITYIINKVHYLNKFEFTTHFSYKI